MCVIIYYVGICLRYIVIQRRNSIIFLFFFLSENSHVLDGQSGLSCRIACMET